MADKRMFSKSIIDSDQFLDMPVSSQCLYFHLAMRADDDGFVNCAKKVMRILDASDDDMKLLAAKQFVIPFQSGVIVIRHWRMHNLLRPDRYKQTEYQEEMKCLINEKGKPYAMISVSGNQMATIGMPNGNQMATQVRLGKDSIDKDSISLPHSGSSERKKKSTQKPYPEIETRFSAFWAAYPKKVSKKEAQKAFDALSPDDLLLDRMLEAIEKQKNGHQWHDPQFIPYPASWIRGRRWEDENISPSATETPYQGGVSF